MSTVTAVLRCYWLALQSLRHRKVGGLCVAFFLMGCQSEAPQLGDVETDNLSGEVVTIFLPEATSESETSQLGAQSHPSLQSALSAETHPVVQGNAELTQVTDFPIPVSPEIEQQINAVAAIVNTTVNATTQELDTNTPTEAKQEAGEISVSNPAVIESEEANNTQEISLEPVVEPQVIMSEEINNTSEFGAEKVPDLQVSELEEIIVTQALGEEKATDLQVSEVEEIGDTQELDGQKTLDLQVSESEEIGNSMEFEEEEVLDRQVIGTEETKNTLEIVEEKTPDLLVSEAVNTDEQQEIVKQIAPDLPVMTSAETNNTPEIDGEQLPDLQVTEVSDTDDYQEITPTSVLNLPVIAPVDTDINQEIGEETVADPQMNLVAGIDNTPEFSEESILDPLVSASADTDIKQEVNDSLPVTDDDVALELLAALPDPRNPNAIPIATKAGLLAEKQTTADIDYSNSIFVDSEDGSDSYDGSVSTPFKTLTFAQSQLTPGTTLYLREGVYFESNVEIENSGEEDNYIYIKNYPGEKVVINGAIEEFYNVNAGNWELYHSETNTYRSTVGGLDIGVPSAYAINSRGEWLRLVSYKEDSAEKSSGLKDLISITHHVDVDSRYVGPGIFNDSGQLYIRLEPLASEIIIEREVSDVELPLDPNEIPINIGSTTPVIRLLSSYVHIEGITITGGAKGVLVEPSASNIVLRNNTYLGLSAAVLAEEGVSNLEIDHSEFDARFPAYIAWTDMKGTDGQSKPAAYWMNKLAGLGARSIDGLKFTNNYFNDIFDGAVLSGSNIEISGNAGFFVDDFVQLGSNSSNVRVFDNRISGAGPSHYGRGNSPQPGTIFIYQNVIKTAREILWGKLDPNNILRDSYSGWGEQKPFQTHAKSAVIDGDPWKIYNNTVIFNSVENNFGIGIEPFGEKNSTGETHAVFNNIFVELGGGIYTKDIDLQIANQVYDGNIYWTKAARLEPIFSSMRSSFLGVSHFDSLVEFRASAYFDETVDVYGMGWELNGLQANPQLSNALVPSPESPASTSNVLLPSSFPNSDMRFRGAIGPE